MCEVIKSSFESLFPLVESTIKKADFVAIDTEFTGLTVSEHDKPSLFDSSEVRYKKLRNSVSKLSVCQIGVSAFVFDKSERSYHAYTFNFPLCPVAFGPVDPSFVWQASSLEFLSRFNFDFNTFVYDGVPFLNDAQERQLCQSMDSGNLFSGLERQFDESFIQSLCSKVAKWYASSKNGETLTLQKSNLDRKLWNDYVIHTEIRRRFPDVWTNTDPFQNVAVEKVGVEKRKQFEDKEKENQEQEQEKQKQSMLGFTRVFRVLREYQKVLVGHNMMMDLLFMYDKFFRPLPAKYSTFKTDLHDLFPRIYDTKHMSVSLKKMVEEIASGVFSSNLGQLYQILGSDKVSSSCLYMPQVCHAKGFDRYNSQDSPHEAGFDAYLCGFCFAKLCHLIQFRNKSAPTSTCHFSMYLHATKPYMNRVNMIRAMLNHINLAGKDPPCLRPQQLFVRCRKKGQKLNRQQLAQWMAAYGTVDIRLLTSSTAVVAAGNFSCARDIMTTFKGHPVVAVTKFRFWKHSPLARTVIFGGLVVSAGVCVWTIWSLFAKS